MHFDDKATARDYVWHRLETEALAAFPFPARGRIPNFKNARQAALNLFQTPLMQSVRCIKVNPDSPQRHVRAEALRRGVTVFVPTPRLAGHFMVLDPRHIPVDAIWQASARTSWPEWAHEVGLRELPHFDAIVTGCVAVTPTGKRAGKGAGYSDLEFAILRELGHPPVPVVTTVHDVQIVQDFPIAAHDQPLAMIATPQQVIAIADPLPAPRGIDWANLPANALATMPVLRDLAQNRP